MLGLDGGVAQRMSQRPHKPEVTLAPGVFEQAQFFLKRLGAFPIGVLTHPKRSSSLSALFQGGARAQRSGYFTSSTTVLTMAARSSVTVMNQVFASAGGLGAVMLLPVMVAGTLVHLRFERSPVSVV